MKFLGMGVPELLIILVVILLIFGPKNLPKLGSALGKTVKNLREGMGDSKKAEEEADEVEVEEDDEDAARRRPPLPARRASRSQLHKVGTRYAQRAAVRRIPLFSYR